MATAPFRDRHEAGQRLAQALSPYANRDDVVVLALPRGGVPVAFEVAHALRAPLDIFVVRKLGAPGHPEFAIGAIAAGGVQVLSEDVISALSISPAVVEHIATRERLELDSYSRSHEGWIVRVAVTEPGGRSHIEARDIPLQGVSADFDRTPTIAVTVGDRPRTHLTHQITNPHELAFEQTEAGAIAALVVRSGDGTTTAVTFRSPMRPEDVDGLPAGRAVASSSRSSRRL